MSQYDNLTHYHWCKANWHTSQGSLTVDFDALARALSALGVTATVQLGRTHENSVLRLAKETP